MSTLFPGPIDAWIKTHTKLLNSPQFIKNAIVWSGVAKSKGTTITSIIDLFGAISESNVSPCLEGFEQFLKFTSTPTYNDWCKSSCKLWMISWVNDCKLVRIATLNKPIPFTYEEAQNILNRWWANPLALRQWKEVISGNETLKRKMEPDQWKPDTLKDVQMCFKNMEPSDLYDELMICIALEAACKANSIKSKGKENIGLPSHSSTSAHEVFDASQWVGTESLSDPYSLVVKTSSWECLNEAPIRELARNCNIPLELITNMFTHCDILNYFHWSKRLDDAGLFFKYYFLLHPQVFANPHFSELQSLCLIRKKQ